MPEYTYRECRVCYKIEPSQNPPDLYIASGYTEALNKVKSTHEKINFSTEHSTLGGARKEIKKIIEKYIDFEWDQLCKIQKDLSYKH